MISKLSGTILNKSDLARALDVSEPTIRHYLEIAEGTFLLRQLQRVFKTQEYPMNNLIIAEHVAGLKLI